MNRTESAVDSITVSVVVPVYNEGSQGRHFADVVGKIMDALSISYEIVFIDDGSTDETWRELTKAAADDKKIRAIRLSRNFGKEAALSAGIDAARGGAVVVMDSDFQHPPELLPEMVRLWKDEGFKIVEARKSKRGREFFLSRIAAEAFYAFMNKSTGLNLTGATDYKLLDRKVVEIWKTMPERITFFRGMSAWVGFDRATVDFSTPPRTSGGTKWSYVRLVRLGINAITSFTAFPLHAVTILGAFFLLFALGLSIQTLYMYFSGRSVSGFTTVILLQLIVGSCCMLGLGILGLYVSRLYEEVKGRPRHIVAEKLNFEDE